MLKNKKAVYSLALTAAPALFAILLILGFFTAYFFVYGAADSPETVISSNEFPPSVKLPLLLNSNISSEKTLKEIIVGTYMDTLSKDELANAISVFSEKAVVRPLPHNTIASYSMRAYELPGKSPIPLLSVESEKMPTPSNSEYFSEFQVLPLPDGRSIVVELYLYCIKGNGLPCDDGYLGGYA